MGPREKGDFRERVRRETLRGKLTVFHENMEQYIERQARAYTTGRVFLHWLVLLSLTTKYSTHLLVIFHDLHKYKSLKFHPNYIKLGRMWSAFYFGRPFFSII